jgi:hypothetical protein
MIVRCIFHHREKSHLGKRIRLTWRLGGKNLKTCIYMFNSILLFFAALTHSTTGMRDTFKHFAASLVHISETRWNNIFEGVS